MSARRVPITVNVAPEILARLEVYCHGPTIKLSRSAVFELAVKRLLDSTQDNPANLFPK